MPVGLRVADPLACRIFRGAFTRQPQPTDDFTLKLAQEAPHPRIVKNAVSDNTGICHGFFCISIGTIAQQLGYFPHSERHSLKIRPQPCNEPGLIFRE